MRERAEVIGGQMEIDSQLGKGTRIRVIVPLGRENFTEKPGSSIQAARKI